MITIAELKLRPVRFDRHWAAGELTLAHPDLESAGEVSLTGRAELAGEGMRLRGRLQAQVVGRCVRCLEPVPIAVERDLDLLYQPETLLGEGHDVEIHGPDTELAFFSGDGVGLEEVVREQILLALPMQLLCREDCRGLCPQCGANRNLEPCRCQAGPETEAKTAPQEKTENK